ncbi:MAG: signal peptidase I [Syntrophobacteraceae bacterium]|nr:signal peptidase I [Desulfobacteraceae bacterium]
MKNTAVSLTPAEKPKKSIVLEYTQSIILALVLALFIRTFIVQTYKIPSGSMEDTLAVGDYIVVNKFIFGAKVPFTDRQIPGMRDPARGDVIVFEFPEDPSKDFIKRVIGVPGDRVQMMDKHVYVNGKPYANPHEVHKRDDTIPKNLSPRDNTDLIIVPTNSYFVMGDNRDLSYDSRFWGFVRKDSIKGLAFIKYFSWDGEKGGVRWQNIGRLID